METVYFSGEILFLSRKVGKTEISVRKLKWFVLTESTRRVLFKFSTMAHLKKLKSVGFCF